MDTEYLFAPTEFRAVVKRIFERSAANAHKADEVRGNMAAMAVVRVA